jgi:serine/threonine protein kinase
MPLSPGQVLNNRYRIVKLLGEGGFGAVYRAWNLNLNGPCALKENYDTSPEAHKQFEREASLLFNLRHPNLPKVFDSFSIPGQGQYLVMEFIEGEDLQVKLDKAGGPLPEAQVLPWIIQTCDALCYLHSRPQPIIHRDIKPANIRITPEGAAILVDFGIAKLYDPSRRTTLGARAVTPGYSPFEQYGQKPTDTRTDVYSLGATLYHLLTGHTPPESVERVGGTVLIPPRQLNSRISIRAEAAILRAMQLMPDQRYQAVADLKAALIASRLPEQPAMVSTVMAPTAMGQSRVPATQVVPAPVTPPVQQPSYPPQTWHAPTTQAQIGSNQAAGGSQSALLRFFAGAGILFGILLVGVLIANLLKPPPKTATPPPPVYTDTPSPTPAITLLSGVLTDLNPNTLAGWEYCWSGIYSESPDLDSIRAQCPGNWLMLGCRPVGNTNLTVAAMSPRDVIFYDVGSGGDALHEYNGIGWYFSQNESLGFTLAGTTVERNSCDVHNKEDPYRLCWHTQNGDLEGGWRCGANTDLNSDSSWERVIYQIPAALSGYIPPLPTAAPATQVVAEIFSGVKTDLNPDSLTGWEYCWSGKYNESPDLDSIRSDCAGGWLLLGCRPAGNTNLTVAAMSPLDEIFYDVGSGSDAQHEYNGVGWYFSQNESLGFTRAGTSVTRNSCDVNEENDPYRLCWHTENGDLEAGYRCGATTGLNGDSSWERVIYRLPYELSEGISPPPTKELKAYTFSGVETDLNPNVLTGWDLCWSNVYNEGESLDGVLSSCSGPWLMMACRPVGDTNLTVAAMGPRDAVLYNVGNETNGSYEANGVAWYYSSGYSWGFALAGATVNRSSCDTNDDSDPYRLCWHTSDGNISGGWRCGANTKLNDSTSWERLIYQLFFEP